MHVVACLALRKPLYVTFIYFKRCIRSKIQIAQYCMKIRVICNFIWVDMATYFLCTVMIGPKIRFHLLPNNNFSIFWMVVSYQIIVLIKKCLHSVDNCIIPMREMNTRAGFALKTVRSNRLIIICLLSKKVHTK